MRVPIKGYRDLEVWQKAMDLVIRCYRLADRLPRSEDFALKSQIRRSAISIPSNIAEGQGRSTTGDYVHHLTIAHGSLMELETQLQIAERLKYVRTSDLEEVLRVAGQVGRMLNTLARRLRARRAGPLSPDPRSPTPDPRSPIPDP